VQHPTTVFKFKSYINVDVNTLQSMKFNTKHFCNQTNTKQKERAGCSKLPSLKNSRKEHSHSPYKFAPRFTFLVSLDQKFNLLSKNAHNCTSKFSRFSVILKNALLLLMLIVFKTVLKNSFILMKTIN